MGGASDRIGRRGALALALALQVAAFLGFARASDLSALYATSILFGFSYGAASTLFPATVADVFGREHAGTLAGLLFATAGIDGRARPGRRRASSTTGAGDYRLAWWLSAACNAVALAAARPFRIPVARPADDGAVA